MVSRAECTVTATRCEFSANGEDGVSVSRGSKGYFTNCTFHHNKSNGISAIGKRTLVELRGEQTEIHHNMFANGENEGAGLYAIDNATIDIYIPSQPTTALVHDNHVDLYTFSKGKIWSHLPLWS